MRPMRSKSDPRAAVLRGLRPLRSLGDRDLQLLAITFDEVRVPAGTVLAREGRLAEECYLIVEGEAEVTIGGNLVAQVGPGDFVGEMALVAEAPRSATVRATTPMYLFTVHKSVFGALLDHAPIARTILAAMTDRLRRAERAPQQVRLLS